MRIWVGLPFVGRAGKLMDSAFQGLGIKREDLYICNIVKCRPPGNRNPLPDETAACKDYLLSQINLVKPKIIVLLGNVALKNMIDSPQGITSCRGNIIEFNGLKFLPTFHPAALLRDPSKKIYFFNDLRLAINY